MEKQRQRERITDELLLMEKQRHKERITDEAVTDGETKTERKDNR